VALHVQLKISLNIGDITDIKRVIVALTIGIINNF